MDIPPGTGFGFCVGGTPPGGITRYLMSGADALKTESVIKLFEALNDRKATPKAPYRAGRIRRQLSGSRQTVGSATASARTCTQGRAFPTQSSRRAQHPWYPVAARRSLARPFPAEGSTETRAEIARFSQQKPASPAVRSIRLNCGIHDDFSPREVAPRCGRNDGRTSADASGNCYAEGTVESLKHRSHVTIEVQRCSGSHTI